MNARLLAARVVNKITDGHSLADCLPPVLMTVDDVRDKALIQAFVYGVCRYYTRLDMLLSLLLQKPMKEKDGDVHALLLVGLYQLSDMRIPPHAAVAETVNAVGTLNKPWAKGFVNAILRQYLRKQEILNKEVESDEEALYAHPAWWIMHLRKAWPTQWKEILLANNAHPPFALRVNARQFSREQYVSVLLAMTNAIKEIPFTPTGIIIDPAIAVESLPDFFNGAISVQDGAAQLAAGLLELEPGQRVLDACAAPGGKLTHILEMSTPQVCVAVEKDPARMHPIQENLTRLQLDAVCHSAGVATIDEWWDEEPFDRILLDAPCSGSGVIRRHPDIKLLRQPQDIKVLVREQTRLLEALWPLLAPGGILLYVTCSVLPEENEQVMEGFLKKHSDATELTIQTEWGQALSVGRQILPGEQEMDGFYYARIKKS